MIAPQQTLTPMIGVHDAAGAIEFYKDAFDAVEVGERFSYEGKLGHAEVVIGGAKVMIADEFPEHNSTPIRLGGTPVILHLTVDDVDSATERAVKTGPELIRAPSEAPGGKVSQVRDPTAMCGCSVGRDRHPRTMALRSKSIG